MIDLRGLPFMPLYIDRLQKSKAWLMCKREPEFAFYLMNLWMRAWQEVPAGTIENDDDVLGDAAMCDPRRWPKIREKVLRGWIETEGRLSHPVVSEIAADSWEKREAYHKRTEKARQTKSQKRDASVAMSATSSVTDDVADDVADDVTEPATVPVTGNGTDDVTALKGKYKGEVSINIPPKPPRERGGKNASQNGEVKKAEFLAYTEPWEQRVAGYGKMKLWDRAWGAPPDKPDCRAPAEFLRKWNGST